MAWAVGATGLISSAERLPQTRETSFRSEFLSGKRVSLGFKNRATSLRTSSGSMGAITARVLKPVVERFKIIHEQSVSADRLKELGVSRWSTWECGACVNFGWAWEVDELVYITKGSIEVIPEGCDDSAIFYAGDLVRFPKWLRASLHFIEDYQQSYKFLAYGD